MVETTQIQAGQYQLVSVYLRNYTRQSNIEISSLIVGFNINESMSAPFINGSTTVFDGQDILSTLPVIGEEYIEFKYTDFFGVTRTDEFMVYSVSDIKYPQEGNSTLIQYTLNFVSIPRILNDGHRIMKAYKNDSVSSYAQLLYNEVYKKPLEIRNIKAKVLRLEATDGPRTVVVPNYSPTETFLFFARNAFNSSSKTQTFRFFENRDAYWFATNEYVRNDYSSSGSTDYNQLSQGLTLPDVTVFGYNYLPNIGPENQRNLMFNIISVDFGEKVNTMNDIKFGSYSKRIGQIDLLTGTAQLLPTYNISQDYDQTNTKLAHTNQFITDNMPDKYVRYVVKDYSAPGDPTGPGVRSDLNYADLYTRKTSYLYHYRQNSIEVSVYGRNNIVAGSVVNLQLPLRKIVDRDKQTSSQIDTERSGYYQVDEVKNIFNNKTYLQKMTLSRYGIGTK